MRGRGKSAGPSADAEVWSRNKLLTVLAAAAVTVGLLATGVVLAVGNLLSPEDSPTAGAVPAELAPPAAQQATATDPRQDALAAEPMPAADLSDALPGPLSTRDPGVIELPRGPVTGPAGVATGFPHTPQGALAQLAAINITAMQTGSLPGVREVIDRWAAEGGPTGQTWTGVRGMATLLEAAGLSGSGSPQLAIVVRPAMGLIKGTVGDAFAVVCVDYEYTVTLNTTARVAIAACQRMVWDQDRWLIGPGPEPAPAPAVWPGTDLAIDFGYRDLRYV